VAGRHLAESPVKDDGTVDASEPVLVVPARGLVLLIGASGSGKTTFARRHFGPTEVLSSDAFRALVADDEADQSATPAAFDVLTRVLAHRLRRGRLSVVDATNILPADRRQLLRLAALARRPTVAIVLDLPESVCQERNARRDGRVLDPAVVRRHAEGIRRALADPERLLGEGFAAVHVLADAASVDTARVVRDAGLPRPTGPISPRPRATRGETA
jgi:predicted kinase